MKKCRICEEFKEISEFHIKKDNSDGHRNECRICVKIIQKNYREKKPIDKEYMKEWRKNNKEKINSEKRKLWRKNYREINKEKIFKQSKEYVEKNREHLKEIDNPKRKERYIKNLENPIWRMKESVRSIIKRSIRSRGVIKNIESEKILGCNYDEFKNYIESKFENWMNYENYGKYNGTENFGWDIDHIIPISFAKTEEEVIKLNHYTNLQPLCSRINRNIKRNKII